MKLKFWRWAHAATERLWHWIYYNRIPEGIQQRVIAEITRTNGGWYSYTFKYMASVGAAPGNRAATVPCAGHIPPTSRTS